MHRATVERDFRAEAIRLKSWGKGLLVAAALFWGYAAWQVFTPHTSTYWKVECSAPAFSDREELHIDFSADSGGYFDDPRERAERCEADRDWPKPLAALVVSAPLSTVGAAAFTTGKVISRMRRHEDALLGAKK